MELLLVRHGQPAWVVDDTARVDPELTTLGRRQAEAVAERVAELEPSLVLVSTATRAQQTAAPLLDLLDGAAEVRDRIWLHEIRQPQAWSKTPAQEVGRVLREARDRPREEWWDGLPGGESFRDFHDRVTTGLLEELATLGVTRTEERLWRLRGAPERVAVVAHAGTNSLILGALLGLEPEPWEWERFAADHASLSTLRTTPIAGGEIFGLQRFSDVAHLPAAMVTA